ncbi:MAG: response regulator [Spirochaetales bacterium]|nr:response regulator [Spirochaetales bacterium]
MNLPTKIILLIVVVMLGVGLGSSLLVGQLMYDALEIELHDQAVVAVQSLAELIALDVINGDIIDARVAVRKMVERSKSIRYAYIVDFEGRLFTHSFENGFPVALAAEPHQHIPSAASPVVDHYKTTTGVVVDIAYPVIEGLTAHVHIGLDEEHLFLRVTSLRNGIIRLTLLLAAVGCAIGIIVSRRLTRPLTDLAGAMHDFGEQKESGQLEFRSGGMEVAELTSAFNRMITERMRAEEALRESERVLRESQSVAQIGSYVLDVQSGACESSPTLDRIFGIDDDYEHSLEGWTAVVHPDDRQSMVDDLAQYIVEQHGRFSREYRIVRHNDGSERWVQGLGELEFDAQGTPVAMIGTIQDITERMRAEKERKELQTQLNQAQKMEAVGRLAGGVAHDFNNMLGVILGHTEMALDQVDPTGPLSAGLQEIRTAADRSAGLTRQLLAFARKQTVIPRVLDLNETVKGMLKMLRRLIGENIDLVWLPDAGMWPVKVDPSQIDQILANLCVNARDAIEGVGKVAIETGNTTFDETYCKDHPGSVPGEYVMLAISDDGCGIDKAMLDNLFEPFFTTKTAGTGLGLSTVYGIVKQNDGFITVVSEPGDGTTFKLYLPRHTGTDAQPREEESAAPMEPGHEAILLVEDEPAILKLTAMMLERQGYVVVAASTPVEALRLAEQHSDPIHLLITDVIMPGMNGRDLAKNLLSLRPDLKCLFMSGYTADVIADRGVIDKGVNFIQKPFSTQDLAAGVREALDGD